MSKTTIASNDEVNQVVLAIKDVKTHIKKLEKEEEKLKQRLYNHMGEHDVLFDPDTGEELVHWTYSEGYQKFDSKRFEEERPKLFKQYIVITEPRRTLRVK